jgi:outer membrane receptor protein involved in Fe transport
MRAYFLGAAAGVLGAIQAAPAAAADEARPAAHAVQELVVTAQRREQAANDVGISLSVVGPEDLRQQGVDNINQLENLTPSLQIEPAFGGGAPQYRLRGVGFSDYASNNSPTVGVYVNEVAYPVPIMTQGLIYDIARVEVLRGPQGTLYGRNTTGGAINFITNKPTQRFSAGVLGEYSRFDHFYGEGYVSGPVLGDKVLARLAVAAEQGGAYQHRRSTGESLGDADRLAGRFLVTVRPADAFEALFDLHAGRDKSEATGLYLFRGFTTRSGAGVFVPADTDRFATDWQIPATLARDTGLPLDAKPGVDNETWGASANATWNLGTFKVTNILSYDQLIRQQYGDWDATRSVEADTFFGSKVYVVSDEFRVAYDQGPLHWVAGVYYSRQGLKERYYSDFLDVYGTYGRVNYEQDVKSISAFGQAEYQFTDQWKLIGGLRYEKETRHLNGFGTAFGGATALPPTTVSTKMTPWTGKIELDYKPLAGTLLYGSISKGAKSGGFTTYNTGDSSAIQPFAPETLWAYEVGVKTDILPRVQLNAAAYYYDYKNQQVLSTIYAANGLIGRFANVPKSEIWGGEIEAVFRPVPAMTLTQKLGYTRGKYIDFQEIDAGASRVAGMAIYVDRSGQRIPFPDLSYSGSASYVWDLGRHDLTSSLDYTYRDRVINFLGPRYAVAHAWIFNADLTLRPHEGGWAASLFARNLFNETYDLTRNFFTSADIAQPGRPREVGVRLSYDF